MHFIHLFVFLFKVTIKCDIVARHAYKSVNHTKCETQSVFKNVFLHGDNFSASKMVNFNIRQVGVSHKS